MDIHILDVECGNMAICLNPDGTCIVIDCNITTDNMDTVLDYVEQVIGQGNSIDVFINTHRDADHMRGICDLHDQHSIKEIWDPDVPGTTTDSPEYQAYMRLRRSVKTATIKPRKYYEWGSAKYRCMNGKQADYSDTNQQSVVVKIEYKTKECSVLFAGDTDYRPWKEKILPNYTDIDLESAILIAAHHGSDSFFVDPANTQHYYEDHIKKIRPAMTLISVGPNPHGLPDYNAVELYKKHSSGSNKGNKVYTTSEKKNMKIYLKDNGGWGISVNHEL
jgi:beta-lactamase superfamily II metal-dependent hydrolase